MTENLQQNAEQKGPFSPLQSGCAFVMLANMLIYLAVVAFTLNLLDPSKIDAGYLAKRGFRTVPEPVNEQDQAFQEISKQKRQQQTEVQAEVIASSKQGPQQKESTAVALSDVGVRDLATSQPNEPSKPDAALTKSSMRSGSTTIRSAQSRLYSVAIFPQATLGQSYSPYQPTVPRPVTLERYDTLSVELAPGLDFPTFTMPSIDPAGAYLYTPPNPVPEAARGGLRLSSPPIGAESLYTNTNGVQKTAEPPIFGEKTPPVKDKP